MLTGIADKIVSLNLVPNKECTVRQTCSVLSQCAHVFIYAWKQTLCHPSTLFLLHGPSLFISILMPSSHPRPSSWNAAIIFTIMAPSPTRLLTLPPYPCPSSSQHFPIVSWHFLDEIFLPCKFRLPLLPVLNPSRHHLPFPCVCSSRRWLHESIGCRFYRNFDWERCVAWPRSPASRSRMGTKGWAWHYTINSFSSCFPYNFKKIKRPRWIYISGPRRSCWHYQRILPVCLRALGAGRSARWIVVSIWSSWWLLCFWEMKLKSRALY